MSLPAQELGAALQDGIVLCHLANHVRPRAVASVHVPSPGVVSLIYFILIKTTILELNFYIKKSPTCF